MSVLERVVRALRRTQASTRAERERRRSPVEQQHAPYGGDFTGVPQIVYEPVHDGLPDPGEVVWAWVPYEEDHDRGKDRPVLVVGRDDGYLLALQMSSQDHDEDAMDEARWGRFWVDVGSGAWDDRRRASEARVDRVLRLSPDGVRRIGAVLDRDRFDDVAAGVRKHAGS
jgi:hypothetical protein